MVDEAVEARPTRRRRLVATAAAAAVLVGGLWLVGASSASAGQDGAGRGDRNSNAPSGGHGCDRQGRTNEAAV
jgi:hypothetical protein